MLSSLLAFVWSRAVVVLGEVAGVGGATAAEPLLCWDSCHALRAKTAMTATYVTLCLVGVVGTGKDRKLKLSHSNM